MQQNFTTNAINLKTYPLSETDTIVLMYSKDKGLIRGVAKGAKKTKSKLGGRMDLLVANKLMLYKGKNLNTIAQAEALNTFYKLRTDMDKMLYSMYCAEIVLNFGTEDDPCAEEVFNLLYSCLEKIATCENKTEILIACTRFQLKISKQSGYGPEFRECCICSNKFKDTLKIQQNGNIFFSKNGGGVICNECKEKVFGAKKMNPKLQKFLLTLLETDFNQKTEYDEKINEQFASFCFNFIKEYLSEFSSKKFKTLTTLARI